MQSTVLPSLSVRSSVIAIALLRCTVHWVTSEKGVHQFRYSLSLMRTPNPIVVCS